jgi:hypothetical protein
MTSHHSMLAADHDHIQKNVGTVAWTRLALLACGPVARTPLTLLAMAPTAKPRKKKGVGHRRKPTHYHLTNNSGSRVGKTTEEESQRAVGLAASVAVNAAATNNIEIHCTSKAAENDEFSALLNYTVPQ